MKTKCIILTGGDGGFGNLGDEWLLASVKRYYDRILRKYKVVILKPHPPKYSIFDKYHYVKDNLEDFKNSGIKIEDIVAVHYYGGGYMNSIWMKEKIWFYDYLVESGFPKDNFFFTGLGLGPLESKELKKTKDIANKSAYFGTRDRFYAKEIKCDFMFDESVATAPSVSPSGRKRNEIWVNFRIANHVGLKDGDAKSMIDTIEKFAKENNLKINYFSMINGVGFDEGAEMKKNLIEAGVDAFVFDRAKNYKNLLNRFKNSKMVITTSYHATLAGLYNRIPVVSLYTNDYYEIKYSGLKDALNSKLLTHVKIPDLDERVLGAALASKDEKIDDKIEKMKKLNRLAYNRYEEFINERAK